ncbi:MAG: amino acid ABC transporter substrate-binding protein [Chloroflexi bacterium]|nr:amino acid ABC transporter substrate-binding protein [Chloroflexota bacterium]
MRGKFQLPNPKSQVRGLPGSLILAVVFCAAFVYSLYFLFAPKPPPKPDAVWTRIVSDGVFRVGIDPSFPPFEYENGKGNVIGFDAALANEIVGQWSHENETPIRVEYVYSGYDGLYDALKAGEFDAILSALPYDARKTEDVRFSHAYFNGGPLIVARIGDESIKTYFDLAKRRVGVELGSSGDAFARRWQRRLQYDVRFYHSPAEALRALTRGEVDGVFTDFIAQSDFAKREGGIRIASAPLVDELFVIAVRKETPTLFAQINAVIDAMKKDGRMGKMQREWF